MPHDYDYASYLAVKKTVDDRALNQHVIAVLRRELAACPRPEVLEIGAGVGTMVARVCDWDLITHARYTLLDVDRDSIAEAPRWLTRWATSSGRSARAGAPGDLHITGGAPVLDIELRALCGELGAYLQGQPRERYDLLIANAVLDMIDLPRMLPQLLQQLRPGGLFWFTINFDGETIFLPEHDADTRLLAVYHQSMDERASGGHSRTGRRLLAQLLAADVPLLASGSSDWVVHATAGRYPARESEFLGHILHTIEAELSRHEHALDGRELTAWLAARRQQLSRGQLVYIAHQLDCAGRRP